MLHNEACLDQCLANRRDVSCVEALTDFCRPHPTFTSLWLVGHQLGHSRGLITLQTLLPVRLKPAERCTSLSPPDQFTPTRSKENRKVG